MKEIIYTIDNVFNNLNSELSDEEIESIIIDCVIIIIWEEISSDIWQLPGFSQAKIKYITNCRTYRQLKSIMDKDIIKKDNLLPLVYEIIVKRKKTKEKYSIYYTPQWLVDYIVENTLTTALESCDNCIGIRILEPSCGAGIFIISIFNTLYNWFKVNTELTSIEATKTIIENIIYGVDLDLKAIEVCKYALFFLSYKKIGKDIGLRFNLYCKDFLRNLTVDNKKFDVIIGNPPYLENRRINRYFDKDYLKKNYTTAVGRFDIYSLFIEKSINLLKYKGKLGFVLPGNLLTNNNFSPIRKLILERTNIKKLVDLGDGIFQNVSMNMAIMILEKSDNACENNIIKCKNITQSKNKQKDLLLEEYRYVKQRYYHNLIKNVFDIDSSTVTFRLRERIIKNNNLQMKDVCEVIAGIATGNIRSKLLTTDRTIPNASKVLEGKNISDYYLEWDGLYFINDKSIIQKEKGEYATFMRQEFVDNEKLLIRQTADRFICAYDDERYFLLNTLYSLKVKTAYVDKLDIKYILALLNSKFYNYLYRSIVREKGKIFPQVKIFHIQRSPLILPKEDIQKRIVTKVDKIINIKKGHHIQGFSTSLNMCELNEELNTLKSDIDKEIYEIFQLRKHEILEVEKQMPTH